MDGIRSTFAPFHPVPPAPPLLSLKNVALGFGGAALVSDLELNIGEGERLALVGRNGSGKSTLLKVMGGLVEPHHGERVVRKGATIRYLPQEPDLSAFATIRDYVEAGLAPGDDSHRAHYLIAKLGLTGDEAPGTLSGGEARRAALARTLAPAPDLLILDEPTNHLDLPAIEWLEAELQLTRSAIVLVSHDRRFLETLSRATIWLDRGALRRLERGFGDFEAWRDNVLEQEERERHKLDRKIAAELDWLRYGVTARRARNQGRLRALNALRQKRREQLRITGSVKFTVSAAETSGKLVAEAENITKALGGRTLIKDLSLRIARGDRLGIVGPNGAGKTTLINMLTGRLAPDSGTLRLGTNLEIAALDQGRAVLDPQATLKETLTYAGADQVTVGGVSRHIMSYLKDFLFAPEQADQPVSALSGGERGRLMLARALSLPSNLLILDEPTNDLDLETLDLLQEMLTDYPGTVILVSHDRDFLDRTATSLLAAQGDGRWIEYAGGYSDMLAQRGSPLPGRAGAKAAQRQKPAPTGSKTAPSAKRKMSFKDKHALETLPDEIEALQSHIAELSRRLADPNLFSSDPAAFEKTAAALKDAEARHAALEEEWLRVALLHEELERQ